MSLSTTSGQHYTNGMIVAETVVSLIAYAVLRNDVNTFLLGSLWASHSKDLFMLCKTFLKVITKDFQLPKKGVSFMQGGRESCGTEAFWRLLLKARDKRNAWIYRTQSIYSSQNPNWLPPPRRKKKSKSSFILTPAFPRQPVDSHPAWFTGPYLDNVLMSELHDLKERSRDHILVLSSALGFSPTLFINRGKGGWRSKWHRIVLWLWWSGWKVSQHQYRHLAEDRERERERHKQHVWVRRSCSFLNQSCWYSSAMCGFHIEQVSRNKYRNKNNKKN